MSQWWKVYEQVKGCYQKHGRNAAIDLLMQINNTYGEKRCHGALAVDNIGSPVLTYCKQAHCWKCGELYVRNNTARTIAHTVKAMERGARIFSIAVTFSDVYRTVTQYGSPKCSTHGSIWQNVMTRGSVMLHTSD
jgi:virulence-associated protein VapD